jgi:hypothetical protein
MFIDHHLEKKTEYDCGFLQSAEAADRVRKRVLISSDFKQSYRVSHIIDCFNQLNNLDKLFVFLYHPQQYIVRNWRTQLKTITSNLTVKYAKRPKLVAHGWRHRPKLPADYDEQVKNTQKESDMSHEERRDFEKREAKVLRYDAWF